MIERLRIDSATLLVVLPLLVVARVPSHACGLVDDALKMARQKSVEIGNAVLRHDIEELLVFVQEDGIYFVDGHFTKSEIRELLADRSSWLFQHLFVGENSILRRLCDDPLAIDGIYERGEKAVLVKYKAKHAGTVEPLENCLIEVGGVWYFDGIFDCN